MLFLLSEDVILIMITFLKESNKMILAMTSKKFKLIDPSINTKCILNNDSLFEITRSLDLYIFFHCPGRIRNTSYKPTDYAALHGQLDVLKLAKNMGCIIDKKTCEYAAKGCHINILYWLIEQNCTIDEWTFIYLARHGQLITIDVLKNKYYHLWSNLMCEYAIKYGHLDVLQYLIKNKCPHDIKSIYFNADLYNQHHITNWLISNIY